MKSSFELILEQFRLYFPDLYDQGSDWWKSGPYHITVVLQDNSRVEFDSSENTIRWLHKIDRSVDNDIFRREIGRNIRKFIVYRGLRQQDVAESAGITEAMLSRYINGTSMPSIDKIHNLASVLNCQINDLLGIEE
jgi:DNA-binding Xre family transcriptional regulator